MSLLKPEFNRSEDALSFDSRSRVHPVLLQVCESAYNGIIRSENQLDVFQEYFNSVPRVVLECSVRDQLLPEAEAISLRDRLHTVESKMSDVISSFEQQERNCASLRHQLCNLKRLHSWRRCISSHVVSTSSGS